MGRWLWGLMTQKRLRQSKLETFAINHTLTPQEIQVRTANCRDGGLGGRASERR